MFPLVIAAALALAAPPPKPAANPGRLIVWLGDIFVTFKPDGSDVSQVKLPDGITVLAYLAGLSPDRKYALHLDYTRRTAAGRANPRLVVTPLEPDKPASTVEGYVAQRAFPIADGRLTPTEGARKKSTRRRRRTSGRSCGSSP
jgi:hypothetical protein